MKTTRAATRPSAVCNRTAMKKKPSTAPDCMRFMIYINVDK